MPVILSRYGTPEEHGRIPKRIRNEYNIIARVKLGYPLKNWTNTYGAYVWKNWKTRVYIFYILII